jgi:hypothetical protein
VAIAYLALAWVVTEVAGTLFPAFGIPDWGFRFVVIVFALGFVPALIISWAYEITPEGLKREKDVVRDASITHLTAKRLDGITIGLITVALAFILAGASFSSVVAQEQAQSTFALPIELEGDYGAPNGDALFLRFMPLWQTTVREKWSLVHLDLFSFADAPPLPGSPINPEPVPGGVATGLSDFFHMTLYTPKSAGKFMWGAGGMVSVPSATDDALGSGKWDLGPAVRITYRGDFWTIGAVAGQRWSFAGSSSRADVSSLMIRGTFRRSLGSGWFFISAPIINANWNSSSGNSWLVPVGGGIGKTLQVGNREWAASVQAYANVIKPDGAPDWSLRFALVAPVPKQWFKGGD